MITFLLACSGSDKTTPPPGDDDDTATIVTTETGTTTPPPQHTGVRHTGTSVGHTGVSHSGAPPGPFTATVYERAGRNLEPGMGTFDGSGCYVQGSRVPVATELTEVLETPSGWFGIGIDRVAQVDPTTGVATWLPTYGADTGTRYPLDFATSITFEEATGLVVVQTRAYYGYLYEFDPSATDISLRGDLNSHNLVALASMPSGELAGLEYPTSGTGARFVLTLSADGSTVVRRKTLTGDLPSPDATIDPYRTWQLRWTDLGLVAIVRSDTHPPAETYVIDPTNGDRTLLNCP